VRVIIVSKLLVKRSEMRIQKYSQIVSMSSSPNESWKEKSEEILLELSGITLLPSVKISLVDSSTYLTGGESVSKNNPSFEGLFFSGNVR